MNRSRWYIVLAGMLLAISSTFYLLQITLFHKSEDTLFYMLQDIAFVPIQVLLVTIIIERLLNERERQALMKKLNMLIGVFFSEMGSSLIRHSAAYSADMTGLSQHLLIRTSWTDRDFLRASQMVQRADPGLDSRSGDLAAMKVFLEGKRTFLVSLLSNPNLLEHDAFTDLLWAVLHLSEELSVRNSLERLPKSDYDHLSGDMKRAFTLLIVEWLGYMKHLKKNYPYLFSLAVRMNPLDTEAMPTVTG